MNQLHTANLENGYYQNPILFGNFSDPSIIRDGEDYFMIHSSVGFRTMLLWHSKNLVDWEPLYYCLEGAFEDSELQSQLSVWAPELVKCDGKYYIYNYSPGYGVWVMVSNDIRTNNWTKPIPMPGVVGIDPGHIQDENGKRWLILSKNYLYPLASDGLSITGEAVHVCEDWPMPDEWDIEGVCNESPKFTQKDGYYYLTVAQGGTVGPATSHAVISFRSKSLEGPYEPSPYNPIVRTKSRKETWWSKGHGTLVDTPEGNWYIAYHAIWNGRRDLGRICLLEPIEWTTDGWFKLPDGTQADQAFPIPFGERVSQNVSINDIYLHNSLGILWNAKTSADFAKTSFTASGMSITAQGNKPYDGTLLWFSAQHLSYEVQIKLTCEDPNTSVALSFVFGATLHAGLIFNNGHTHVHHLDHDYLENVTTRDIGQSTAWLKLINRDGTVSPWYSRDGQDWHKINACFEVMDWSSNTGSGFGYVKPCISVFGNGEATIHEVNYCPL